MNNTIGSTYMLVINLLAFFVLLNCTKYKNNYRGVLILLPNDIVPKNLIKMLKVGFRLHVLTLNLVKTFFSLSSTSTHYLLAVCNIFRWSVKYVSSFQAGVR